MAEKKKFVFAERKKALQMAATCGLSVIEEKVELRGYQIYVVEQWVCDRKVPSNVVNVFTGDESHVIQVAVIAISTAELQHSRPQIQTFLQLGAHLKSKPTPLGEILLTNPGELPYDMDMILVPNGDYDRWIKQAYVNINLRRTNCTGRSSLNLQPPNPASEEKFRSLYKIADTVHFQDAVINLVSLVQIALYLFKLLDKDYVDGLLCDETTHALWAFYASYIPAKTADFHLKEPWMEPHLVAAIISKLIVCRNKLQDAGFTTVKDPFLDHDTFRFDIGDYQKYKNMRITRFLDKDTVVRLNEPTNPIHSLVGQMKVKRVIKSKLDDISGVTNSPLSIETSDPEVFRHHATIESLRAIWRPKLKGGLYTTLSHNNNLSHTINNNDSSGGMTSLMSEISHSNSSSDQPLHPTPLLQPQDQSSSSNELIHMLKKTTKTGGAAVDILKNRVAGTFPWINTTSDSKAKLATSPTSSGSEVTSPSPSVTSSPSRSQQAQQPPPSSSPNSSSHLSKKSLSEKSSRKPSPLLFTQTSSQKNLSATPSPPLLTASTRHSKKRIPSIRRNNKHNTSLEPNTTTTIVPLTSPIALNPTFYDYNTHTHHSYALASSTSPYLRKSKSAESNAATFTSPKSAPILSSSRFFFTASPNTPSGKPSNTDDHYHLESTLDDEKRKGTLFEKAFGKQQKEDVDEKVFKEDIEERGEDTEEEEEEEKEDKVKEDEEEGDFVPYLPHSQKQDVVRRYHRTRSLSDSLLFDPGYLTTIQQQQNTEWKKESDPGGNDLTPEKLKRSNTMTLGTSSYSRLMPHAIDMDDLIFNADVYGKEASTMVDGRDETAPQRPKTIMNVQTYLIFERLLQKQRQLEQYYQQVKSIAAVYEKTADRLKMTYENRMKAFEQLQSKSRRVIDEQSTTAQRLKHVEDHSAKLHYELNVLNDKLKEIEENVGTFFGKVGVLERKMGVSGARTSPASPSQATTGQSSASASMMIVGNYLNHYWTKISQWMTWLQPKESLSHDQSTSDNVGSSSDINTNAQIKN